MTWAWTPRSRAPAVVDAPVAALDVGSSKFACCVARSGGASGLAIEALARAPAAGVRAGAVVDMRAASHAIRRVVDEAQEAAGVAINRLVVGFSGRGLASSHARGAIELGDEPVGDPELRRALTQALRDSVAPGRVLLQAIPTAWRVDDEGDLADPRGLYGARLEAEAHVVTAPAGAVRNLSVALDRVGLELKALVAASYASGLACLLEEEAALGATVIDLGAEATTAAVFADGVARHVGVTPIGGARLTADLAHGLGVSRAQADDIKTTYGDVSAEADGDRATVPFAPTAEGGSVRASVADVARYLRPRVEEIFELVRGDLAQTQHYAAGGSVVLTGGGAALTGVAAVARRILGRRLRVARLEALGASHGAALVAEDGRAEGGSATAIGLARHALAAPPDALNGPPQVAHRPLSATDARRRRSVGWRSVPFAEAARWLRENF